MFERNKIVVFWNFFSFPLNIKDAGPLAKAPDVVYTERAFMLSRFRSFSYVAALLCRATQFLLHRLPLRCDSIQRTNPTRDRFQTDTAKRSYCTPARRRFGTS
jgi:hypothetical protein